MSIFTDTLHELAGIHDGQIAALKVKIAELEAQNEYLEMIADDRLRVISILFNAWNYASSIPLGMMKRVTVEIDTLEKR